jgi:DhnA family fructose-bisphosphate aldolase class Ia
LRAWRSNSLRPPCLILAADHRARGILTVEHYASYLAAIRAAIPEFDGILASTQPLRDLVESGSLGPQGAGRKRTYLSLNRTGLAGSAFELDDRLVTSVQAALDAGYDGVKHLVRIDMSDPVSAKALELLGRVLEEARGAGLEAMIESLLWTDGRVARDIDSVIRAAVIAHDIGSPVLKLAIPDAEPGTARTEAVARVVQSVGVPVLFLGGPRRRGDGSPAAQREAVLDEVRDAMAGGAAGMAVGRVVIEDPDPAEMAKQVAAAVHGPS